MPGWCLLACPHSPDGSKSVIIHLPENVGGWGTVGVVQRTRDIDFVISLPFWLQSTVEPFQLVREQLGCRIYYDPASDDCLLINESGGLIFLTRLATPGYDKRPLLRHEHSVVSPGIWRISIFEGDERQQHLMDFCVFRRQFAVDISETPTGLPSSTKRSASGDGEGTSKRQRLEGDVSEVLLAPAVGRPQVPSGAVGTPNAAAAPSLGALAATPTQQISRSGVTPLLRLLDGEVAIVKTVARPNNSDLGGTSPLEGHQLATPINSPAAYELQRVGGISNTMSSSVFVGRHSKLSDSIVAKVIKYSGNTARDLVRCAMKWQTERGLLEKMRHRNIVSLKTFDARLSAV